MYCQSTSINRNITLLSYSQVRSSCVAANSLPYKAARSFYPYGSLNVSRYALRLRPINAVSTKTETEHKSEDDEVEKFNWFKNWWPVQVEQNLPTDRPYPIELLGKYYVVWKGHSGQWIAMDDECPHRMAPLSEGRIEKDGNLLCSYHAWRFNESGKCVRIPHAEDEKAHSVACNSPRSSVQTYPCKTRGGILWIWPDKSTNAFNESEKVSVPLDEYLADYFEQTATRGILYHYVRYLPYSFDVLMENLCDPSHFTVSHHGVMPFISRYNAKPLYAKLVKKGIGQLPVTAALRNKEQLNQLVWTQYDFLKPGTVSLYTGKTKGDEVHEIIYLTTAPVRPGKTLIVSSSALTNEMDQTTNLNPLKLALKKIFIQFSHLKVDNPIFDGDTIFLHEQDKKIRKRGMEFTAGHGYYFPTSADLLVLAFRKWFETEGGHGAAYGGNKLNSNERELTRQEMLDRYEQHTKHCKLCRESLQKIEFCIKALEFLSLGALFVGSLILLHATNAKVIEWKMVVRNISLWTAVAVCSASAFARAYLEKNVRPLFYFEDWVHADKD
eukprot:g1803.t1